MCKIMIYFHHLRIYMVLNERVFIKVTDVIDTSLRVHYSIYKQTWLNFKDGFMVPYFILCVQAWLNLSDVQRFKYNCNFIVFHFYIVIQFCSSIVVYLDSYYSCNFHSCIVNYTMLIIYFSFIFIQFIQFILLCSLYRYSFKQK